MPRLLQITEADRKKVRRLYASGKKPAEIAKIVHSTGLTVTQISGIIERAGLPKLKPKLAEARAQSAREALDNARAASLRDLEQMLETVNAGLKIDTDRLRDAWELVADPAGASSLMRAKALLLSRLFKVHGLDVKNEEGSSRLNTLALVYGCPIGAAHAVVDVTATAANEIKAAGAESDEAENDDLEFADA